MKKFQYKFSGLVIILLCVITLLTLAGVLWNIFNIIELHDKGVFYVVIYSLLVVIEFGVFLTVFAVLISSGYSIVNQSLICRFGFIKFRRNVSDIERISVFQETKNLVVYFKNNLYTVIIISEQNFNEFIKELRDKNNQIVYTVESNQENKKN